MSEWGTTVPVVYGDGVESSSTRNHKVPGSAVALGRCRVRPAPDSSKKTTGLRPHSFPSGSLPKRLTIDFIRALEKEIRLGYWPHLEFRWTDTVPTANELSAVHSRDLPIRAMDLFHIAIASEIGADEFLTFDGDQANLARAAGLPVWNGAE